MATEVRDLMSTESSYAILNCDAQELGLALRESTDGQALSPFDLDRVKVPTGGATTWTIPTLEGDVDTKALEGVVIYQRSVRSFWRGSMAGGGTPPDCASQDGVVGIGDPGGECAECPFAQFGSKVRDDGSAGRGQACKMARLLFLIRPDSLMPIVVSVPPSSIKDVRKFFLRMGGQGIRPIGAEIRLELEKTKNADGIAYSVIKPSLGRRLTPDETARMARVLDELRPVFAGVRAEGVTHDIEDVA